MKATICFIIPEFHSIGSKEVTFSQKECKESTFNSILNNLNKKLSNNWESITFNFDGDEIMISKHWFLETDFNFELSHTINGNNF